MKYKRVENTIIVPYTYAFEHAHPNRVDDNDTIMLRR